MPDLTMLQAAMDHVDVKERAVARWIVEASPIAELLPQRSIDGAAYRYDTEGSLGTVAHRGVGGSYTANAGVINPQYEGLSILGGEVTIDKFEVEQMSNYRDLKGERFRMKARAAGIKYSEMFLEGDTAVDPLGPDGLRKRLTGDQLMLIAAAGGQLTLPILDEAMDRVIGEDDDKVIFLNDAMRRYIMHLAAAENGTFRIGTTEGAFHKNFRTYRGAQMRLIRREDDGSTFLGFNEDPGDAVADTCSMYICRLGMDYIHGITGKRGMPGVEDHGETHIPGTNPGHFGRIEWYYGFVMKHPRSAVRISGILEPV